MEVSHHNDCMVNCLSDGKSNNMVIADSTKLKSFHGDFWEQELSNIKIHYYTLFTDLLKRVCDAIPLVKEGVDRSKYSFCASSLEEFLRWNVGKQRACEWKRAGLVRKTLLDIVKKNKISFATEENVWPRHVIMSWCRKNGFVPMTTEKMTLLPEPKWSGVELCSVSNVNDLLSNLKEDGSKSDSSEDDIEIDILEISNKKSLQNKGNSNHQQYTHLPHLNPTSAFVKETASQIGVDIKPLEMEPSVHIPVIEEMILSACRQFATNIIRNSLNAGYNRMGGQLCPEEITVSDVYSAVKDTPEFDFLSNNYLGVPKEEKRKYLTKMEFNLFYKIFILYR
ncbi:YEATS domain-containing protein 2 [Caerostris extrusa]|uniref:YEATS domain-containing protein 2 n=1 Tax=Caerostris extrusa TaxID=172846 RepID=A0AAV4UNK8_CAEEX|nr:YEATS domain-containing protein 2 [Caerostris extrusa]